MQLFVCSELACPLLHNLSTGVAGAAVAMATPGRQLPAALCDESQDAVAALYILLQVRSGFSSGALRQSWESAAELGGCCSAVRVALRSG
jgi:hypothetical protein